MKAKLARWILGVVVILLVIGNFVLALLTNYASVSMPQVFTRHPYLVWFTIGIVLLLMIGLTLVQYLIEKRDEKQGSPQKQVVSRSISGADMRGYKYDAFISYSHKDSNWVHNVLVPKLERHGFSVLIDSRFKAGAFGPQQMEDGVNNSRRVVAVFTPEYFKSDWAKLENIMAQVLDPAARDRKLIPVLHKTCEIPLRLAGIHYRDLRTGDENAWERLIEDLM
jgi:hypothetical protein